MRHTIAVFSTLVLLVAVPLPSHAQEDEPGGFKVFWRDGLRMETNDGQFQLRLGGRMQFDWLAWGDDADVVDDVAGPLLNGTEVRRARLFVQGYMYEKIEYKLQFDFADGEVAIKDLYFGIRHDTYGVRIGHMKEPFSIEVLTSSKYITFVERSLISFFAAERNSGFMLHGDVIDGDFTYGVGVFRESGDDGTGIERGRYNLTGRFAGSLRNQDDGRSVVHLGASYTYQNGDGDVRVFRQRPEAHLAPNFISSGPIPTDSVSVLGIEAVVVEGPFSAQGEWKTVPVQTPGTDDPRFSGWYAFGSYFITGESRPYGSNGFERLYPTRNFLDGDGLGALEVAVRYSRLDLEPDGSMSPDALITGTRLDDLTLGLNWYWNPMTLMRFNVVRADIHDVGDVWSFLWRGQLEF